MNYKKYLVETIMPYWMRISPDDVNGGIKTFFDDDGNECDTNKNVWFLGRSMWSYALTYRLFDKNPKYLEMCERIYRYLEKCTFDGGRLPFVCTKDGKPEIFREYYYYSEAFAAIGCAQYYRICGKKDVWEKANLYYDKLFKLYMSEGDHTQDYGIPFPCKTFGLNMIMLNTAQFMRNVGIDEEKYDRLAKMALNEMMNGGFADDEKKIIFEHVGFDGKRLNPPYGLDSCPGHIFEAAWFVLCESEIKNDADLRAFGKKLVDYAMPVNYTQTTVLIPSGIDTSKPLGKSVDEDALAWAQQEAMAAYGLAYSIFGEEKYKELFEKTKEKAFPGDGTLNEGRYVYIGENNRRFEHVKGPFHLERMLMALEILRETGRIKGYME